MALLERTISTLKDYEEPDITETQDEPLMIGRSELESAMERYPIIKTSQKTIENADYTLKGKLAREVHLTHFEHKIKMVMIYDG